MHTHGIEGHHLSKHYGSVTALDDVSICAASGTILALLGPNGAGKTTLLKILSGLCMPDAGWVRVDGVRPETSTDLAYLPDTMGFWPHLTGLDNLSILARMSGRTPPRNSFHKVIERVGLTSLANRRCAGYSLGEMRRLAMALVLLRQPRVLLLDEPTTGLDVDGVRMFRETLRDLANTGCAILLSSHELSEVEKLSDVVAFIVSGNLTEMGSLTELLAHHGKWRLRVSNLSLAIESLTRVESVTRTEVHGDLISIWARVDPTSEVMEMVHSQGLMLHEWSFAPAMLEDVWPVMSSKRSND